MKAIFAITHGHSSRTIYVGDKVVGVMQELYGKDVYVQLGGDDPEKRIESIRNHSTVVSIEDKEVEVGPYLVQYKLVKTI